jgi:heme/copper-type cytochrome/quinol oxidase subunit 2
MTINDAILIVKKVGVGIIVTVVPFIIIFGGLYYTQKLLSESRPPKSQIQSKSINNETRTSH